MRRRWSCLLGSCHWRYQIGSSLYCISIIFDNNYVLLHTLVLSSAFNNQLNTVVCLVGCEVSVRSPVIAASVVDALDDSLDRLDVGGRTVKKDERDLALGVGFPGDCERLADGDDAVKTGLVDGVTSRVTLGSGVG